MYKNNKNLSIFVGYSLMIIIFSLIVSSRLDFMAYSNFYFISLLIGLVYIPLVIIFLIRIRKEGKISFLKRFFKIVNIIWLIVSLYFIAYSFYDVFIYSLLGELNSFFGIFWSAYYDFTNISYWKEFIYNTWLFFVIIFLLLQSIRINKNLHVEEDVVK